MVESARSLIVKSDYGIIDFLVKRTRNEGITVLGEDWTPWYGVTTPSHTGPNTGIIMMLMYGFLSVNRRSYLS